MPVNQITSEKLFTQSKNYISGGVNSPVRSFKNVDGNPLFIKQGKGQYIFDEDDNKYIDFVGSWGPMILGHTHPSVVKAIISQAQIGTSFGAPTKLELEMATLINECMPSIEKIRMVSSGTEATMSAIRLARGYTNKNKIIKFEGCYHGHGDYLLAKSGSGVLTHGIPECSGVPKEFTQHTITAPYNDLNATKQAFAASDNIAAVIVEPIAGNNNLIMPQENFLQGLRKLCDENNSLLIFDEVITGFRVSLGGAQEIYNIKPDLTCLGKIIGGGLPVGAFGGKKEIMDFLAPTGTVYQAGTLSGNPLAMTAGIATIKELKNNPTVYKALEEKINFLLEGIKSALHKKDIECQTDFIGGVFGIKFINDKDNTLFNKFFHHMLEHGVYFAPSAYECGFMSIAHTKEDIEHVIKAASLFVTE